MTIGYFVTTSVVELEYTVQGLQVNDTQVMLQSGEVYTLKGNQTKVETFLPHASDILAWVNEWRRINKPDMPEMTLRDSRFLVE